jgi:hypothetical protein
MGEGGANRVIISFPPVGSAADRARAAGGRPLACGGGRGAAHQTGGVRSSKKCCDAHGGCPYNGVTGVVTGPTVRRAVAIRLATTTQEHAHPTGHESSLGGPPCQICEWNRAPQRRARPPPWCRSRAGAAGADGRGLPRRPAVRGQLSARSRGPSHGRGCGGAPPAGPRPPRVASGGGPGAPRIPAS